MLLNYFISRDVFKYMQLAGWKLSELENAFNTAITNNIIKVIPVLLRILKSERYIGPEYEKRIIMYALKRAIQAKKSHIFEILIDFYVTNYGRSKDNEICTLIYETLAYDDFSSLKYLLNKYPTVDFKINSDLKFNACERMVRRPIVYNDGQFNNIKNRIIFSFIINEKIINKLL